MPAATHLSSTPFDHIPPDFTVEDIAKTMTREEMLEMTKGSDPVFTEEQVDSVFKPPAAPQTIDETMQRVADADVPKVDPAAAAPQADQAPAPSTTAELPPPPVLPDLTQARQIISEHDAAVDSLSAKLDEGDMTRAEYDTALKKLIQDRAAAEAQIAVAQAQLTTYHNTVVKAWTNSYMEYVADKPFLQTLETTDPDLFRTWDAALQAVNSNPAFRQFTNQQKMDMAYDQVQVMATHTGRTMPPRVNPAQQARQAAAPTAGVRTDPRPEPMQGLGGLAGASTPTATDGRGQAIDNMVGEAAEAFFARLSPDEQEAYLREIGGDYTGRE